jgi:hypothetical protein
MGNIRIYAITAAAFILAACHRANYLYVALRGENVEIRKTGEPPLGYWRFGGEPIPILYALKEPGVSFTLAVGKEAFAPSLEIVSSVPIRAVSTGTSGWAVPKTQFEYKVVWNSVQGGNVVQIKVDLEDRADAVLISGVIATSGTFYYSAGE